MPRTVPLIVCGVVALAALAGCTSGEAAPTPTPGGTTTVTSTPATSGTPVDAGPTTVRAAAGCPFVGRDFVHVTMGVRLGRTTVLRSGGRVLGCRFYALQGGSLHRTEHLPGPNQPVVQIGTQRWSTAVAAHNAFVLLARRGTNLTPVSLVAGVPGVCFQTRFDPADHGRDWACATSSGRTEVVVHSVDTTGTFNTVAVTKAVLRAL